MTGLVDGNNFFVSCERVFDLSLENRPVAVLSNNDGCCISRSNEFKALNIPMGTPYFKLKPFIQSYGLVLKSSNYRLYADMSHRMIETLRGMVQSVEQYSIDEAFIFPELDGSADYYRFGKAVRQRLLKWVGIPCGVGFAPNRTLAKIANHLGKKSPEGVFVMPEDRQKILEKVPVSEVWGVGRKLAPKLEHLGIRNAWQLAMQDPVAMQKRFSVLTARIIMELRGATALTGENPDDPAQSISYSRSFGYPVTALSELSESVAVYTAHAAEKLRQEKLCASGIVVYFTSYPQYRADGENTAAATTSLSVVFDVPTDDTGKMLSLISPRLPEIYSPDLRYKKSGVIFFGLESAQFCQNDLFSNLPQRDGSALYQAVDALNARYGKNTLFTLGAGVKKNWQMRRDLLSPEYTTCWDDLLTVD